MFGDAIKEITGILDKRFLMYVYLPVIAFCLALMAVWITTHEGFSRALVSWRGQGTFEQVLEVGGFLMSCFVLATVLAIVLASLTRMFEGYWSFPGGSILAEIGRAWHQNDENYDTYPPPAAYNEVMPTRLGNVLKNAELYPQSRYGIDSGVVWPRLYGLLPPAFIEALVSTRAEMEFTLLVATLGAAFASIAGIYLFVVGVRWWIFLACVWGGFALSLIAYRSAISGAQLYGVQIRVAFDLYRKDLLKQLGFPAPGNLGAERTVWERVCAFLEKNADSSIPLDFGPDESPPSTADANDADPAAAADISGDTAPKMSLSRLAIFLVFVVGALGAILLWVEGPGGVFNNSNSGKALVIIQLNDTYRIDAVENGKGGGLGRVASLIRQARQDNAQVLLVHAGDFIAPSLESKYFQGRQMIDAMNFLSAIAPMHVVPGNHEFDEAEPSMLANAIRRSNFSWICSNLKLNTHDPRADKSVVPHEVVEVGNFRVGIFALTIHGAQHGGDQPYAPVGFEEKYLISDDSLAEAQSELGEDVSNTLRQLKGRQFDSQKDFQDALAQVSGSNNNAAEVFASVADYFSIGYAGLAEQEISKLEEAGANVIIGLTHLNMSDDRRIAKLRQRHPNFIWIAGGHEHYAQREALSPQSALITKADSNARSVWKITINLKDQGPEISAEKILINEKTYAVDENYQRQISDVYHDKLTQNMGYLDRPVGMVSQVNADRCFEATEEVVRNEQSDWGTFLADRMRNAYANQKAQIGILNGGTIRIDDNFCDLIRYEQLERSIGFSTRVVYVKLSGANLKDQILEHAVRTKRGDGRFVQVAGLKFDFNRLLQPGHRVFNVQVQQGAGWTNLNPASSYSVALSEYIFDCGDEYDFRRFVTDYIPAGPDLRSLVVDSFNRVKSSGAPNSISGGPFEAPAYLKDWSLSNSQFVPIGANNQCPRKN